MLNIINFPVLDSTNKYALENLKNLPDRTVITCEEQTGGRGRLQRKWLSPPQVNIYCSLVLKNLTEKPAMLTIIAALAVLETLRKYNLAPQLKWPNDVLVGGKKICGILAETKPDGLVLGIGVNVNTPPEILQQIEKPATSLLAETGQIVNKPKVLTELLESFFVFYDHVLSRGFAYIAQIWQNELQIIDKKVRVKTVQKEFEGTVSQIDADGALIIQTLTGLEKVLAGDVYVV